MKAKAAICGYALRKRHMIRKENLYQAHGIIWPDGRSKRMETEHGMSVRSWKRYKMKRTRIYVRKTIELFLVLWYSRDMQKILHILGLVKACKEMTRDNEQ